MARYRITCEVDVADEFGPPVPGDDNLARFVDGANSGVITGVAPLRSTEEELAAARDALARLADPDWWHNELCAADIAAEVRLQAKRAGLDLGDTDDPR